MPIYITQRSEISVAIPAVGSTVTYHTGDNDDFAPTQGHPMPAVVLDVRRVDEHRVDITTEDDSKADTERFLAFPCGLLDVALTLNDGSTVERHAVPWFDPANPLEKPQQLGWCEPSPAP